MGGHLAAERAGIPDLPHELAEPPHQVAAAVGVVLGDKEEVPACVGGRCLCLQVSIGVFTAHRFAQVLGSAPLASSQHEH